jgi:hypothetical protein
MFLLIKSSDLFKLNCCSDASSEILSIDNNWVTSTIVSLKKKQSPTKCRWDTIGAPSCHEYHPFQQHTVNKWCQPFYHNDEQIRWHWVP